MLPVAVPDSPKVNLLKLALGVINGQIKSIHPDDFCLFGFEEAPGLDELRNVCEDIVLEAIVNGVPRG